jgi:DNA polymerase-3 subunit alpha
LATGEYYIKNSDEIKTTLAYPDAFEAYEEFYGKV